MGIHLRLQGKEIGAFLPGAGLHVSGNGFL